MRLALPTAMAVLALLAGRADARFNTPPVSVNDVYSTIQADNLSVDAPGVLSNDVDTDPLTAVLVDSSQASGFLDLQPDGSFEYEPATGSIGVDVFTYRASDGVTLGNPATITFTVELNPGVTLFAKQAVFESTLASLGYAAVVESFENPLWPRYPVTAQSVTNKGLTWSSNYAVNGITTGPGPALFGQNGFFSIPHGDQGAGPQCAQPGVCTDGWMGVGAGSMVAIGGWVETNGAIGKLRIILDGGATPEDLVDFDGLGIHSGGSFFGVLDLGGFDSFEYREMSGKAEQQVYIFSDRFTFAFTGFREFGAGCPGTGGVVPRLSASGAAIPGGTVTLEVRDGLGGASGLLVFGTGVGAAPMGAGCDLLVTPLLTPTLPLFLAGSGAGGGSLSVSGPLPTGVSGYVVTMQAFVADPGGALGFSNSNGLRMDV